jgi:hypothetical protein
MNIIDKLKELNIETDRKKICVFDFINIIRELENDNSEFKNIIKQQNSSIDIIDISYEFNFFKNAILDKKYIECNYLLNNHYCNGFLDIFFIINNPYLFDSEIFNVVYKRREEINNITLYIKNCWNKILASELKKFYNSFLINKWMETLEFKIIDKYDYFKINKNNNAEDIYNKYQEIYRIFDKNICNLREYIYTLNDKIKNINHPGCFNLNHDYYYYFIKLFTGLEINKDRIKMLFKYALRELTRLNNEYIILVNKIYPESINVSCSDISKILKNDINFKYKSKTHFKETHEKIITDAHKYFIESGGIIEYKKVNLAFIDDPNLSVAYWAYNTFYLNLANWEKLSTYESLALTLHEAIPGHHTQLNYSIYSENKPQNILYHLFGLTNGFCEGWALFIESSYPAYTITDHIGRIQYEILRTLRIIIDIALNFVGISIEDCKKFVKNYLAFDDKIIETELFRYITMPGQALCYKIGCEIFRKIKEKYDLSSKSSKSSKSIKSEYIQYIQLYKKIIYGKEKTLESLLHENNLTFEEVFI